MDDSARSVTLKIILPFAAIAVLWIVGSDALVALVATSPEVERQLQMIKGLAFVLLTSGVLALLLYRQLALRQATEERRRAEAALLHTVFDHAPAGVGVANADGRWLRVNPQLCRALGRDEAQLLQGTLFDAIGGDGQHLAPGPRLTPDNGMLEIEQVLAGTDERSRRVRLRVSPVRDLPDDSDLYIVMVEDISARKEAEQALERRTGQLQLALGAARMAIWDWTLDTDRLTLSPEIHGQLGYTPEELQGSFSRWASLIDDEQREPFVQAIRTTLHSGRRGQWELQLRHRDGHPVWVQLRLELMPGEADAPAHIVGAHTDITERKQAELRLRQSEQRYRLYFERNPIPMWTYEAESRRFLSVNDSAVRHYGYSREEFLCMTIEDIRPPEDLAPLRRMLQRRETFHHGVWRHRTRDGSIILVEVSSFDLPVGGEPLRRLVMAQDVTDKYRTEHRLRRYSSRLKRLSQRLLSAQEDERRRIALELHDHVGQTLTAAQLDLDMLREGEQPPQTERTMARVHESVATVLEQVRNLSLDLQPPVLKDLGLSAAVRWLIKRHAEAAPFELRLIDDTDTLHVPPDVATACFRIVQEALNNATRHSRATRVTVRLGESDTHLTCNIEDDGRGFDYAAGAGQGSSWGLGLFGIEERAQLVGGWARVESAPGEGTRIEARLPTEADPLTSDAGNESATEALND